MRAFCTVSGELTPSNRHLEQVDLTGHSFPAPLEDCAPPSRPPLPPLPAGARFLALRWDYETFIVVDFQRIYPTLFNHRLFGTPQSRTLYFLVEAKSRVREVYAQTCHHFSKQGMLDTDLFGLAVLIGEFVKR